VICLADYDFPTRSASGFLIRYVVPRSEPPQLVGELCRKPLFTTLTFGDLIIAMGHGDPDTLTGQNEVILMDTEHIPNVKGKIIKLVSCETGQKLGPALINAGAIAFQGFKEDFVWVMDADYISNPWADPYAAKALLPVVDSINSILDGKTNQEAFKVEKDGFSANIAKEEDELVRSCLEFDRDNAVLLGDPMARVRPRPKFRLPLPPPPILIPIFQS